MYEFEAIAALALAFITAYFIGSYRNRKLLMRYARAIRELVSPFSENLGFRSFGHSGFRSLTQLKKDARGLSKIEMAVSLVDRENLMHYPLSLLTKEYDRFVCWATTRNPVHSDIEIISKLDRKSCDKIVSARRLTEVEIDDEELNNWFTTFVANNDYANKFLSDRNFKRSLFRAKTYVRRLSLNREDSRLFMLAELRKESLEPLLNLIMNCGEALTSSS